MRSCQRSCQQRDQQRRRPTCSPLCEHDDGSLTSSAVVTTSNKLMLFDKSELPALWDSSGRDHGLLHVNDVLVSRWRFIFDLSSANKRSRSFFYSKSNHTLIFSSTFKGFFQFNLRGETTRAATSPVILNQTRSVSASGSVNELLISSAALMRRIQHSETNLHKKSLI